MASLDTGLHAMRVTAADSAAPATSRAVESATHEARRFVALDGLRGLAALAIVVHHFTATSGHREVMASSTVAVEFFFCAGGFVVAAAHHRQLVGGLPFARYMGKRLARIYPMYLVGILLGLLSLSLLKVHGLTTLGWVEMAQAFGLNAVLLPYLNDGVVQVLVTPLQGTLFPFNNPAWSLFFLLVANGLYALTARWRWAPFAWLVAAAALLIPITFAYGEAPGWGTANLPGGFPRVTFSFFAGVVMFLLRDRIKAWLPAGLLFALALMVYAVPRFPGHRIYWLTVAFLFIPVLVLMSSRAPVRAGSFLHRACLYAGRLSYPIYCVHYPLLMAAGLLITDQSRFAWVFAAFILATLAAAHFFMRVVEEPVRSRLSRRRVHP